MLKPQQLREALQQHVPWLKTDPDRLVMYIEKGQIASGLSGLGFEYRYTLVVGLMDYSDHPNLIMYPILQWLRTHQPSLLQNPDTAKTAIQFEAEIQNNQSYDLRLDIQLTERVMVEHDPQGQVMMRHLPEPKLAEQLTINRMRIFANEEPVYDSQPY